MLVALGAIRGLRHDCEVLHYEAPFGVGYLVAQLTNVKASELGEANVSWQDDRLSRDAPPGTPQPDAPSAEDSSLPALARVAVETFVRTGAQVEPPASLSEILTVRAACFVTIRLKSSGDLRGCIGTVEPSRRTLAEELIANAIRAATHDPRFGPVSPNELPESAIFGRCVVTAGVRYF